MDTLMKPGEEVTGRIRWEQPVLSLFGYIAGETGVRTFKVQCPEPGDIDGPWVLTSMLPGQYEWRLSGDEPEPLRRAAEGWVAEFVSSLGAVFPAGPVVSRCECGGLASHRHGCRWRQGYGSLIEAVTDEPATEAPAVAPRGEGR
jgi:hypothetical protein